MTTPTSTSTPTITTARDLRRAFWRDHADNPRITRRRVPNYSGNGTMHTTDTRCAFADFVDRLSGDGVISQELARRVTL